MLSRKKVETEKNIIKYLLALFSGLLYEFWHRGDTARSRLQCNLKITTLFTKHQPQLSPKSHGYWSVIQSKASNFSFKWSKPQGVSWFFHCICTYICFSTFVMVVGAEILQTFRAALPLVRTNNIFTNNIWDEFNFHEQKDDIHDIQNIINFGMCVILLMISKVSWSHQF